MICCPTSFGRRSGEREKGGRVSGGEERVGGEGRREREELTTPSTPVSGRGGFEVEDKEEEPRGGGEEDFASDEFPILSSGSFFPVSDEFP